MRSAQPFTAALLGLLLGVGLGLLAGWVVWPAQYDSITPELLSIDHQTDYAKIVAAGYSRADDIDLARSYLARLGPHANNAMRRAVDDDPAAARLLADLNAAPAAPTNLPVSPPTD